MGLYYFLPVSDEAAAIDREAAMQNLRSPRRRPLLQSSKAKRSRNANHDAYVSSKDDCFFEQYRYPALPVLGESV